MLERAVGKSYRFVIGKIHERMLFDWYLEIGCRGGETFALSGSPTLAVDPYFRVEHNVIRNKPALHIFQTTSDTFFDSPFLERNAIKLGFAFLDGMHLIEYLLRDFRNTERNSDPGGVIAVHDCCPWNVPITTRDLDSLRDGVAWTGDVWKLLPILQRYRPDLKITVLDANPSGLVMVSNLDPDNTVLFDRYDEILASYEQPLDKYGLQKFANSFDYVSSEAYVMADFPDFHKIARPIDLALKPAMVTP